MNAVELVKVGGVHDNHFLYLRAFPFGIVVVKRFYRKLTKGRNVNATNGKEGVGIIVVDVFNVFVPFN